MSIWIHWLRILIRLLSFRLFVRCPRMLVPFRDTRHLNDTIDIKAKKHRRYKDTVDINS